MLVLLFGHLYVRQRFQYKFQKMLMLQLIRFLFFRATGKTLIETKHMTVQDDIVDPTPVLRTFLMRLLLKYK